MNLLIQQLSLISRIRYRPGWATTLFYTLFDGYEDYDGRGTIGYYGA